MLWERLAAVLVDIGAETHHHPLLPMRAKKALTAPSKSSVRPRLGWPSTAPFLFRYFRGYRTDHHRPKAKKKVPRRALPRKLAGIGLILWTCKDKQCLRALSIPKGVVGLLSIPRDPHPDRAGAHGSAANREYEKWDISSVKLPLCTTVDICVYVYLCGCT